MTLLKNSLTALGAIFISAATAISPTITTIIPYLGDCTTTTTLTGCSGTATVIIQTPIVAPECTTPSIPTPTPGGPCVVKPLCAPAGLDIEYYNNPFAGYSRGDSLPSSYYITQNLRPLDTSLTNVTFFPQDRPPTGLPAVYPDPAFPTAPYWVGWRRDTNGGVRVDANNFTLVYQGFYKARKTGTHMLCSTADNENDVFFGHGNAFSCLDGKAPTDATPLLVTTGGNYINGIVCKNVDLVAGMHYPVRNVMGDWQGPSAFNFTIQEPGVAFENRVNDFTGRAYPHQCGGFR